MSTNATIWTVLLIVAWIGSCWWFYWIGKMDGKIQTMRDHTEQFDNLLK